MNQYVMVITIHADPAMAPGYEEWGGTHIYMKELLDGFAAKKIKCVMFTRKCMNFPNVEQYNEYCTVIRLQNGEAMPINKTLLWRYHDINLAQIQAYIDKHGRPEVIHSVYWNSGRIALELSQSNGIPFVHSVISNSKGRTFRGATEDVPLRSEYEQQIFECAKWVICVSNDERNDIVTYYDIPPEKIVVAGQHIHESFILPSRDANGFPRLLSTLNTDERNALSISHNSAYSIKTNEQYWNHKVFTYVGRVGFNKGLEQIVKAWYCLYERFNQSCPPLWIAGGSIAEIHNIRDLLRKDVPVIDNLEKSGHIMWWGHLDPAGLSTLLMKTLALVMHSYYEPGGRVIVEAMAEGVPVIATPYGFGRDYIVDWQNGFLVEYGDVESLCSRLAHFLHQPYLSDALGNNARQDAKKIIKTWNFIDNHLMAYGIHSDLDVGTENESQDYDYFKVRRVNLFPYYNIPLSENYIREFVNKLIGTDICDLTHDTNIVASSDIYRANIAEKTIIIKQVFTRLRLGPMLNPFDKGCYVKKADHAFRVELDAYKKLGLDTLIGYDETHFLFAFKELSPIKEIDFTLIMRCIDSIVSKSDTSTAKEKSIFHEILCSGKLDQSNISEIYRNLEKALPNYYFEHSGCFCEKIGWASAPFIMDFNRHYFQRDVFDELADISLFFYQNSKLETEKDLRSINSDVKLRHFMLDDGSLKMVDLEKWAVGSVEVEIAGLFYDYLNLLDHNSSIHDLIKVLPKTIDIRRVLSYMAHISFYDIQVDTVMQRMVPVQKIELLRLLFQMARGMLYTRNANQLS